VGTNHGNFRKTKPNQHSHSLNLKGSGGYPKKLTGVPPPKAKMGGG